ncbi:MgtC/SapB family protein [Ramlibacter sp. USB13]|uniref:Protein MgtC n=1 Tax=Ramlibacter cellulosilyticus TaxID=2764187 RepID=A0A923SG84_9BURK|nr:MgtC/SapB family protein [Ramlibacter cellulosilyticus]MBC5784677.1 MgtC/SapB family protein [Ramlibacter cellulosilyticus]
MTVWQQVADTIVAEFSDLGDVRDVTQLVVRLLLAALLGGILGYERERQGKPAGVRTHMLVAASSALVVLVATQSGMDKEALSRVLQGLLSGVGFVCAGAILKLEKEEQVHGLTTAAGVWMTAAIGIAAGLGREMTAALSTLIVLGILLLEGPIRRRMGARPQSPDD